MRRSESVGVRVENLSDSPNDSYKKHDARVRLPSQSPLIRSSSMTSEGKPVNGSQLARLPTLS